MTPGDRERLEEYAAKLRHPTVRDASLDALWPAIQSRIERGRQPETPILAPTMRWQARVALGAAVAVAVAATIVLAFTLAGNSRTRATIPAVLVATTPDSAAALRAIDDSVRAYREETRILLDRLEIARAVLPPQAARAVDHDLRVVDSAITELNAAIERHPSDATLRRLLAASYRQKLDVLQRIENAG